MKKRIAILGSTGSIGTQALQVIDEHPDLFEAVVLTANNQVDLLIEQARRFQPDTVVIANTEKYEQLKEALSEGGVKVYAGSEALCQVVESSVVDVVLTALVGFSGLQPTIHAIRARKQIALANKETLVVAGELVTRLARQYCVPIIPVDSEHSAIFQSLAGEGASEIDKILLTASGGPVRGYSLDQLEKVTLEQALNHPRWTMGAKITVDSATMMNKGLEVIEARWLFDAPPEKIQILVHPQSIVHSAVEFEDKSVIAQMGVPDMRIPISLALGYPDRLKSSEPGLDFFGQGANLTFEKPDTSVFKCIGFAYDAIREEGSYPVVLNGANEALVDLFLRGKIRFVDIQDTLERVMDRHRTEYGLDLEGILEADCRARESIKEYFS